MSLSSPSYIAFFAAVFVLFYLLPGRGARLALLLAVSIGFYVNIAGVYTGVLLGLVAITYGAGLLIKKCAGTYYQSAVFAGSVVIAILPLILLKYLFFIGDSLGFPLPPAVAELALPVGLSYFTFAAIGYLIDVRLDIIEAEDNPLRLAVFITFFPLITSGPIERGGRFLPQLDVVARFSSERALAGLRLIFIGLVLKVLLADALAMPVAAVFGEPDGAAPLEKFVAMVFFPFNLYADFAGYSLIAIGSAKMLGLEVQPNFRQPFLSQSIPEFWRTWHMSLSFWVRDYLFTPLRAHWRRAGAWGLIAPTMLTFLVIGAWHGAGWPFIILGLCFGLLAVASIYTMKYRDAAYAALRVPLWLRWILRSLITFILVALVLVLFRANYLDDALSFYRDIFSLDMLGNVWSLVAGGLFQHSTALELPLIGAYWPCWLLIAAIVTGDILVRHGHTLEKYPVWLQVVAYNVGTGAIVYQWMTASVAPPFLYYKF
jgi:D-alanyl-lipoteichoic acid acyltransferase DltB (MBOAT superfamily)